jgi:hypothetical protein
MLFDSLNLILSSKGNGKSSVSEAGDNVSRGNTSFSVNRF